MCVACGFRELGYDRKPLFIKVKVAWGYFYRVFKESGFIVNICFEVAFIRFECELAELGSAHNANNKVDIW